jgi:Protein of unknown function (DUF2934)
MVFLTCQPSSRRVVWIVEGHRMNGIGSGDEQDTPTGAGSATSAAKTASRESRLERISRRAYELYEARGRGEGIPLEDWLQAEQEIDAEQAESVERNID